MQKELNQKFLKPNDLICPTKLDKHSNPEEFGYCPEKQIITKDRFNIKPRFTTTENNQCMFPYIFFNKKIINPLSGTTPLLKINFNCFKKRKEEGSWCYVKNTTELTNELEVSGNDKQIFLIGATKNEDVFYGLWSMDKILDDTSKTAKQVDKKKLKDIFELLNYKEEKCLDIDSNLSEQKKIEKRLDLNNITPITLENYDHSYCMLSESKKGYSKKQLYIFGRDILDIPYTLLINKNKKILSKQELCKMFEEKINELKKEDVLRKLKVDEAELNLKQIYTKEPEQCNQGEGKGGYKLLDLRNIATTFLGLKFDDAFSMNKQQLCNYIIPKVFNEEINSNNNNGLINNTSIYPINKDKNLCEKPINRGGINIKTVRDIANKLNIKHKDRLKEDICKDIRIQLENIKNLNTNTNNIDNKLKLKNNNSPRMTNINLEAYTNTNFNI